MLFRSGSVRGPTASTSRSDRSLQHPTLYDHEFELRDEAASGSQNHSTALISQYNSSSRCAISSLLGLYNQVASGSGTHTTASTSQNNRSPPQAASSDHEIHNVASGSATHLNSTAAPYNPSVTPPRNVQIPMNEHTRSIHYPDLVCDKCGKSSFGRINELRRHQRSVHEERQWICKTCNRKFSRGDTLLRHQRKLHRPK